MTRARLTLGLVAVGLLAATAAPALADDGQTRVCVILTNDRNNPGPAALCAWVPDPAAG